mmetsp:Transcript_33723/g.82755  ORF Transcript_33723/g.82755 Transcript_33723/m.82755 type:complete len:316 (+) Transcript_33723:3-950(+)
MGRGAANAWVALSPRHRRGVAMTVRADAGGGGSGGGSSEATTAAAPAAPSTSSTTATTTPPPPKSKGGLMADDMILDSQSLPSNFCIIEGRNTVRDFADMAETEIQNNIESRKNRVFIMLEEVRRLRVQLRLKLSDAEEPVPPPREYESVVPGFPRITENTFQDYYIYWAVAVVTMLIFGGLIAPLAEVKLGLGGTSYAEFIASVNLPQQLAMVDPIVASFTGGAVGAISAYFVIEINNYKEQETKLCLYCNGTGYLTCAECSTSKSPGRLIDPKSGGKMFCGCCSGTAKVMCTSCLCTGMAMVTEHDPRIDPFD